LRGSFARRETFLARYPRKFKVAVFLFCLIVLVSPLFLRGLARSGDTTAPAPHSAQIQGADARNAAVAQTPAFTPDSAGAQRANTVIAVNDQDDPAVKLIPAPDPMLSEDTESGSLPRIGADGRAPWQAYARPYNLTDNRPRIAIVVADMGLSRVATDAAINRLPRNVTLAFDAQSPVLGSWCIRARQYGHEIILNVPMEPFDYPRSDPGTRTLLTTISNAENIDRFKWALRQGVGYVGVTTLTGSHFVDDAGKLAPIMAILKERGLMAFDARLAPYSALGKLAQQQHIPLAESSGHLDQNLSPDGIDQALGRLEQLAETNGRAVAIVSPYPVMLDRLAAWAKTLPQRGISLAPLSAMVERGE